MNRVCDMYMESRNDEGRINKDIRKYDIVMQRKDNKDRVQNNQFKRFYAKYKNELLSRNMNELKKVYDDTKVQVVLEVVAYNQEKRKIKRKFTLSQYEMDYVDYSDEGNDYSLLNGRYVESKPRFMKERVDDLIDMDLLVHEYADDIGKDNKGIFKIVDDHKEYLFYF